MFFLVKLWYHYCFPRLFPVGGFCNWKDVLKDDCPNGADPNKDVFEAWVVRLLPNDMEPKPTANNVLFLFEPLSNNRTIYKLIN